MEMPKKQKTENAVEHVPTTGTGILEVLPTDIITHLFGYLSLEVHEGAYILPQLNKRCMEIFNFLEKDRAKWAFYNGSLFRKNLFAFAYMLDCLACSGPFDASDENVVHIVPTFLMEIELYTNPNSQSVVYGDMSFSKYPARKGQILVCTKPSLHTAKYALGITNNNDSIGIVAIMKKVRSVLKNTLYKEQFDGNRFGMVMCDEKIEENGHYFEHRRFSWDKFREHTLGANMEQTVLKAFGKYEGELKLW